MYHIRYINSSGKWETFGSYFGDFKTENYNQAKMFAEKLAAGSGYGVACVMLGSRVVERVFFN